MALSLSAQTKSAKATKTVGYYYMTKFDRHVGNTSKSMDSKAQYDPLLELLKTDPNFTVTELTVPVTTATTPAPTGWNDYDIVILQESAGSQNQIVKDLKLTAVTKPYLINKIYGFRSGGLFVTGGGSGLEANNTGTSTGTNGCLALKVITGQSTNPIFSGCDIVNDTIHCFNKLANDTGALDIATSAKAINYNSAVVSTGGTLVAEPFNTTPGACSICINTFLSGGTIGTDGVFTNKVITLGFNYGAMCADDMQNITGDGLSICRNAVYILGDLTPPATKAVNPTVQVGVKDAMQIKNLSYQRIGNQIQINFGQIQKAEVSIYNLSGQLISKKVVNADNAVVQLIGSGINIIKVAGSKVSGVNKYSVF
jgi:hypothetical protein